MSYRTAMHIHTSTQVINAAMPELIHGRMGGHYHRIDDRRKRSDDLSHCTHVRSSQLEDLFSSMMGSERGGVLDVVPQCSHVVIDFMRDRPGTAGDLHACVITCTPDDLAQQATIRILGGLVEAGMDPTRMHILFSGSQPDVAVESAFSHVHQYVHNQLSNCVRVFAEQRATRALEKALPSQVPIGLVLNGGVDFQKQLTDARLSGAAQDVLQQLAKKLLAQRLLIGARADIEQLLERLGLPQISPEEWLADVKPGVAIDESKSGLAPNNDMPSSYASQNSVELST